MNQLSLSMEKRLSPKMRANLPRKTPPYPQLLSLVPGWSGELLVIIPNELNTSEGLNEHQASCRNKLWTNWSLKELSSVELKAALQELRNPQKFVFSTRGTQLAINTIIWTEDWPPSLHLQHCWTANALDPALTLTWCNSLKSPQKHNILTTVCNADENLEQFQESQTMSSPGWWS